MTRATRTIGLVTCDLSGQPYGDEDQPVLEAVLAARRLPAEYLRWDDPAVDWSRCAAVVLRSTWDYTTRYPEFLAWSGRTAAVTRLLNPLPVVRWNADKTYLAELAAAGVPTVPTIYLTDPEDGPAAIAGAVGDSAEVVVKPTVSAGSRLTGRFRRDDPAAVLLLERILAEGGCAMVQPYLESVGRDGELAVMFLGGRYSHSIRKGPILDRDGGLLGGSYREVVSRAEPTAAQLACAEQVLAAAAEVTGVHDPLLYARVDLIAGAHGEPTLLELELIEPSLFFPAVPEAAERFADLLEGLLEDPLEDPLGDAFGGAPDRPAGQPGE